MPAGNEDEAMTMIQTTVSTTPVSLATWAIDPAHTTVEFAVRHMMVTTVKGYISGVEGTIAFDDADPTRSSVTVSLDAASIDTREPKRDAHLRSADFFDAARFPKITFASTMIEPESDGYRIIGDLTMHGVTREIALSATFEGRQHDPAGMEHAGFTAHGILDRREFELTWNQSLEAAGIMLGNDVRITIEVEAVRQA
jgi:polyisoprenoid-binding protein YceI